MRGRQHQGQLSSKRAIARALEVADRVPVRAAGSSMGPFLSPVASLWVTRVAPAQLAIGDVVAFARGPRVVLHRLVGRSGERWLVRGDAQPEPELLDAAEVLGRVEGLALRRLQWRGAPRLATIALGRAIARMAPWWQRARPFLRPVLSAAG